ncbi:unnamed protein product [Cyprideis torosa]|uniref:Uncharacterized protein n=1 Tax=Cyprideis torosa TaxID=163714 RepID=A0A7R8WKA2_9CRUS|nr:unnamed protein product [Cyprideis torosa]CAG0895841.1 unnamed protein product [Cyprideis torosa]
MAVPYDTSFVPGFVPLSSSVFAVIVSLFLFLFFSLYIYYTAYFELWEKQGVPTLKPVPFIGSRPWNFREVPQLKDLEYRRRFGKIWGEYRGRTPYLFVADPEVAKDVLLRDFDSWSERRFFDYGSPMKNSLDMLPMAQGKFLRNIFTPGLTASKLKLGSEIFNERSKALTSSVGKAVGDLGKGMELKEYFSLYALDVMAEYGFGMKLNLLEDPEHPIAKHAILLMDPEIFSNPVSLVVEAAPALLKYGDYNFLKRESGMFFRRLGSGLVEDASKQGSDKQDFLGLLVRAVRQVEENREQFKQLGIDRSLVEDQVQLIIGAVYDNIRTSLTLLTHALALHPDKQRKLIQEVDASIEATGGEITYDTICMLNYTEVGACVLISSWALGRDLEQFTDPDEFIPERFEEDKQTHHPFAWQAFGHGPRKCIGMRFSILQMKFLLCNFFRDLEIYENSETVPMEKLEFAKGSVFMLAFKKSIVGIRRRQRSHQHDEME